MQIEAGQKYLVTTSEWFIAPDGQSYKAVFGEVRGIQDDKESLGIKTNRNATNWFLEIGSMIIAGCQIHYAIKTDECSRDLHRRDVEHEGKLYPVQDCVQRIYFAGDEA